MSIPPINPDHLPTMPTITKKEDKTTKVRDTDPSSVLGSLTMGNGIPLSFASVTIFFHAFIKFDI